MARLANHTTLSLVEQQKQGSRCSKEFGDFIKRGSDPEIIAVAAKDAATATDEAWSLSPPRLRGKCCAPPSWKNFMHLNWRMSLNPSECCEAPSSMGAQLGKFRIR